MAADEPGTRRRRGWEAEELAARHLAAGGLRVVARNHATRQGEVDLICEEGPALVFVEVRSRADEDHGGPEETVDGRKRRRVIAAATDWALRNEALERDIRFDVVAITFREGAPPRIEHFRAAFDGDGRAWHG